MWSFLFVLPVVEGVNVEDTTSRNDSHISRLVEGVDDVVVNVNDDNHLVKDVNLSSDGLVVDGEVFLHVVIEPLCNLERTEIRHPVDNILVVLNNVVGHNTPP